jgi:hypothetical protein
LGPLEKPNRYTIRKALHWGGPLASSSSGES